MPSGPRETPQTGGQPPEIRPNKLSLLRQATVLLRNRRVALDHATNIMNDHMYGNGGIVHALSLAYWSQEQFERASSLATTLEKQDLPQVGVRLSEMHEVLVEVEKHRDDETESPYDREAASFELANARGSGEFAEERMQEALVGLPSWKANLEDLATL